MWEEKVAYCITPFQHLPVNTEESQTDFSQKS
jgi:hypothetical protein